MYQTSILIIAQSILPSSVMRSKTRYVTGPNRDLHGLIANAEIAPIKLTRFSRNRDFNGINRPNPRKFRRINRAAAISAEPADRGPTDVVASVSTARFIVVTISPPLALFENACVFRRFRRSAARSGTSSEAPSGALRGGFGICRPGPFRAALMSLLFWEPE